MSAHTPHELHDEFPHDARVLHLLKLVDTRFCNLAERYHAFNRAIHRIECEMENTSDMYLSRLRRQRLALLDEIAAIIESAEERFADRAGDTPTPPAAGLLFGAPRHGFDAANDRAQVPA
ncbi:MAG: DUF465 domain-containing protein [Erythrobacter sp.]|nr:DUF465 domain-containing protein [Erythrobacter sp.]